MTPARFTWTCGSTANLNGTSDQVSVRTRPGALESASEQVEACFHASVSFRFETGGLKVAGCARFGSNRWKTSAASSNTLCASRAFGGDERDLRGRIVSPTVRLGSSCWSSRTFIMVSGRSGIWLGRESFVVGRVDRLRAIAEQVVVEGPQILVEFLMIEEPRGGWVEPFLRCRASRDNEVEGFAHDEMPNSRPRRSATGPGSAMPPSDVGWALMSKRMLTEAESCVSQPVCGLCGRLVAHADWGTWCCSHAASSSAAAVPP